MSSKRGGSPGEDSLEALERKLARYASKLAKTNLHWQDGQSDTVNAAALEAVTDVLRGIESARATIRKLLKGEAGEEEARADTDTIENVLLATAPPMKVVEIIREISRECDMALFENPLVRMRQHMHSEIDHEVVTCSADEHEEGKKFLEDLSKRRSRMGAMFQREDFDALSRIKRMVAETFGTEYTSLVSMLAICMRGQNHQEDIELLESIVRSQCIGRARRARRDGHASLVEAPPVPHFGDHMREFLQFYARVTEFVHARSSRYDDAAYQRAMGIIGGVLRHPQLRSNEEIHTGRADNLYALLREAMTLDPDRQSPWFSEDLSHTPFSARKVADLIRPEGMPELVGAVLVLLNDYEEISILHELQAIVAAYDRLPRSNVSDEADDERLHGDVSVPDEDEMEENEPPLRKGDARERDDGEIFETVDEDELLDGVGTTLQEDDDVDDLLERLDVPVEDVPASIAQDEFAFVPEDELHRRINAIAVHHPTLCISEGDRLGVKVSRIREIIEEKGGDLVHAMEFEDARTLTELPGEVYPDHLALRLLDPEKIVEDEFMQQEFIRTLERIRMQHTRESHNPILAESIQLLLWEENPFLDVPLPTCNHRSMRTVLMELALDLFDENVIRLGPFYEEGDASSEQYRPLFPMIDALPSRESREDVRKNFNTAFLGIPRQWLIDAASAYLRGKKDAFTSIIIPAYKRACFSYFSGTPDDDCLLFHNASAALESLVLQCIPDRRHANIVRTDQEYDHVDQFFHGRDGVRIVGLKDAKGKHCLTAEGLFRAISREVDTYTQLIIISTKTRYGDAPCATDDDKDNLSSIQEVVGRLQERFPNVLIVIDTCQSLGRAAPESLKNLGNVLLLGNGSKVLGAKQGGFMIVPAAVQEKLEGRTGHRFDYRQSTIPIEHFLAAAWAMEMYQGTLDHTSLEGNLGEERRKKLHEKTAERMRSFTDYAIRSAEKHGLHVCEPTHRNRLNYTGIITLTCPGVSAEALHTAMHARGYQLSLVHADETLRISFDYRHTTEDIRTLLSDVQEEWMKLAGGEVRRRRH